MLFAWRRNSTPGKTLCNDTNNIDIQIVRRVICHRELSLATLCLCVENKDDSLTNGFWLGLPWYRTGTGPLF